MGLAITVHRGTKQIGGSCIELRHPNGQRLVLDAGRPLDASPDDPNLVPETLDQSGDAAVLFSHPHMDHWGLVNQLPDHWPLWTGSKSAQLMKLTAALPFTGIGPITRDIHTWTSRTRGFAIGSFRITPILTDHSAFDAYMLLIEAAGQRLLYTGDFRIHGRKHGLVQRLMANPPAGIDVLLMEGTNLKSHKPVMSETELERIIAQEAKATAGQIFVECSTQNIDRIVTLYRVARRTGRDLVVDLYTADVLEAVAHGTGVPRPTGNFDQLKVVMTGKMKWMYRNIGRQDHVERMLASGRATSRAKVAKRPAMILTRKSLLDEYGQYLPFGPSDLFIFSNWSGYLDENDPNSAWAKAAQAGARTKRLHTSGHASAVHLAAFAAAMAPKTLVPVHGTEWDDPQLVLPPVTRLGDGEMWTIPD